MLSWSRVLCKNENEPLIHPFRVMGRITFFDNDEVPCSCRISLTSIRLFLREK